MSLLEKRCTACKSATQALKANELPPLLMQISGWDVLEERCIRKLVRTPNFSTALQLANQIGDLAEAEGHHPDLLLRWGELRIDIFTHKVNGLTEADFVLAAKIDRLLAETADREVLP